MDIEIWKYKPYTYKRAFRLWFWDFWKIIFEEDFNVFVTGDLESAKDITSCLNGAYQLGFSHGYIQKESEIKQGDKT